MLHPLETHDTTFINPANWDELAEKLSIEIENLNKIHEIKEALDKPVTIINKSIQIL